MSVVVKVRDITQVMSSQNKEGEVRTENPVSISSGVNVKRPDCLNQHQTVQLQMIVINQN